MHVLMLRIVTEDMPPEKRNTLWVAFALTRARMWLDWSGEGHLEECLARARRAIIWAIRLDESRSTT